MSRPKKLKEEIKRDSLADLIETKFGMANVWKPHVKRKYVVRPESPHNKFKKLMKQCGGSMHVAVLLGKSQIGVAGWETFGIPRKHWPRLIQEFGLNAQDLYDLDEEIRIKRLATKAIKAA